MEKKKRQSDLTAPCELFRVQLSFYHNSIKVQILVFFFLIPPQTDLLPEESFFFVYKLLQPKQRHSYDSCHDVKCPGDECKPNVWSTLPFWSCKVKEMM